MSAVIANRHKISKSTDCCGNSGKLQTHSMQTSVVTEDHDFTNTC